MKKIENSECLARFGDFIKKGRIKRDMLQSEVAAVVGITQAYYSYIENGSKERNVDLVLALKICQALGLDLNDFIKRYM